VTFLPDSSELCSPVDRKTVTLRWDTGDYSICFLDPSSTGKLVTFRSTLKRYDEGQALFPSGGKVFQRKPNVRPLVHGNDRLLIHKNPEF
jgi:hypothetical protein